MKEELKQSLSSKPILRTPTNGERLAAVLIPLFFQDGQYHILFTKRTQMVHVHRGEVAFPGGAYEERDGSLLNTALRESEEEIGLLPHDVEILGALDFPTTASSGYLISSFVGVMPWPYTLKLDRRETEEAFTVPVAALLDRSCFREEIRVRDGKQTAVFYYDYQGKTIWGATARILSQFLNIYTQTVERLK